MLPPAMPITADEIRLKILTALPDAQVTVEDTTGGGDHYSADVVAAAFRGKELIEQHRMVYAALGAALHGPIHALALHTRPPEDPAP
jgi:stress-induced morphogen